MRRWVVRALVGLGVVCAIVAAWAWTPDRSRADLYATYLDAPGDIRQVAGMTLHVRDSGPVDSGRSVILLHGLGAHLQTWDAWAAALAPEFRVVRIDLPGAGLSYPDVRGDYTDARSVEIVAALMDDLGIEHAHLIGHSVGGRIAWRFAATHRDRVARLVLVTPDGFASPGFAYGRAPDIPGAMHLMTLALPKALLRPNLEVAYGDPARMVPGTLDRYHDLMLAPGNRQALIDRMAQTVLTPPEPLLARITAPVLLVWGARDAMIPVANAQAYLDAVPDARLVVLPGLGHIPQEEDGAASVAPVIDFLR